MRDNSLVSNRVRIRSLAHGRAGDKGNTLTLSVIARHPHDYDHLIDQVTIEHCLTVFESRCVERVERYLLPNLHAMNFVLSGVLDGGVNRSLHWDRHGKTLSSHLLDSLISAPTSEVSGK